MQASFWEQTSFYARRDVLIIGAGLQGLWCAFALKQLDPALRILVLERAPLSLGASTRNAGFACFGSPTELLYDAAVMGGAAMRQLVNMRYQGIRQIRRLFTNTQLELDDCGGYECLHQDAQPAEAVYNRLPWLNEQLEKLTGIPDIFTPAGEAMEPLGLQHFDGLIANRLEAGLHSGKLLQGLQQLVQSLGVDILHGFTVTACLQEASGVRLPTAEGPAFFAGKVLCCTNAFTRNLFPQAAIEPGRGQILVTAPQKELQLKGCFHYNEGFYYFRNLGNRILLGGARNSAFEAEHTTRMELSDTVQQALEQFLAKHIRTAAPVVIEQRWSGIMGFTPDKLPLVQQPAEHTWMVCACNGMGLALSPIIAAQAAACVLS